MSKSKRKKRRNFEKEVSDFFQSKNHKQSLRSLQNDLSLLSNPHFWNHQECEEFCLSLSKEDEGIGFLIQGFLIRKSDPDDWSGLILKYFVSLKPDFVLEIIRFRKLFLKKSIFQTLEDWANGITDEKLKDLVGQMKILYDFHRQQQIELLKVQEKLSQYEWIDLLSLTTIWWEDLFAKRNLDNPTPLPDLPPDMGKVVSIAIRARIQLGSKAPEWEDPIPLQEQFLEILNQCKNPDFWSPFKQLMDWLLMYVNSHGVIDSFAYQGHQIISMEDKSFMLVPESREREEKWDRIGQQYQELESYYLKYGMQVLKKHQRGLPGLINPLNPGHQIRWSQLAMPETVNFHKQKVDTGRAVLFLTALGEFHKERYYKAFIEVYEKAKSENEPFPTLTAIEGGILGTNLWLKPMMGPLNMATSKYMVDRVLGKVGFHQDMNSEELEAAVEFLALDITKCSPDFDFHVQEFPFLKFGKVICYLTNMMVLSNPSYLLQNRLFKEAYFRRRNKKKRDGRLLNEISKNFEEYLRELFFASGFQVKTEEVLLRKNGKDLTDIDVLAWKGNELLVVQAKNTYSRHRQKDIAEYMDVLHSAGNQVDVSIQYIQANKGQFLEEHQIEINPKKLQIFGLVVSATPEGNYERYGLGKYPKISSAELTILLQNTKGILVNWELEALIRDFGSRQVAEERLTQIQLGNCEGDPYIILQAVQLRNLESLQELGRTLNTWEGKDPSISTLMERIETDWLWEGIIVSETEYTPSVEASNEEKQAFVAYQMGKFHFHRQENKEAISCFEKAWDLYQHLDYLLYLADSYAERGLKWESLKWYDLMVRTFPNIVEGYTNRAATYWELREYEKALKDYEQALTIDPGKKEAILGTLYFKMKLKPASVKLEDIQKAVSIDPDNPMFYQFLLEEYGQKISLLEKKPQKSIEDLFELSDSYFHLFDKTKALIYIKQIIDRDPTNTDALYQRGWFKVDQGMLESAKDDFQKVLEYDPKHAHAWEQIGSIELAMGEIEKAKIAYENAIEFQDDFPRCWYNFGLFFFKIGIYEEAIPWLKKAQHDFEIGIEAHLCIAQIYERQKKWKLAQNAYREAVNQGMDEAYRGWLEMEMKLNPPSDITE